MEHINSRVEGERGMLLYYVYNACNGWRDDALLIIMGSGSRQQHTTTQRTATGTSMQIIIIN